MADGRGASGEAELLARAYRNSLALAIAHALRSVAFPAISTGIYRYPLGAATRIALREVREVAASGAGSLEEVVFACFGDDTLGAYYDEGIALGR